MNNLIKVLQDGLKPFSVVDNESQTWVYCIWYTAHKGLSIPVGLSDFIIGSLIRVTYEYKTELLDKMIEGRLEKYKA